MMVDAMLLWIRFLMSVFAVVFVMFVIFCCIAEFIDWWRS